jgi:X-Pro dipeptidyl-peptidase
MKFVIDWLNGRAKGSRHQRASRKCVRPGGQTGKVGMIGTSYDGTLPLAAATSGVEGLEVVVPVSPNTSYYHYYRANGLVRSPGGYLGEDVDVLYDFVASGDPLVRAKCDTIWRDGIMAGRKGQDRATGDFNDFWAKRDLLPHVQNIKAAVLLAHGLNDNVTPDHSVRIYNEMKSRGLPVSIYLHQGGHGGNPPAEMLNRWFSHSPVRRGQRCRARCAGVDRTGCQRASARRRRCGPGRGRVAHGPHAVRLISGSGIDAGRTASAGRWLRDRCAVIHRAGRGHGEAGRRCRVQRQRPRQRVAVQASPAVRRRCSPTPSTSLARRVTLRVSASVRRQPERGLVMLPYDSANAGAQSHRGSITHG